MRLVDLVKIDNRFEKSVNLRSAPVPTFCEFRLRSQELSSPYCYRFTAATHCFGFFIIHPKQQVYPCRTDVECTTRIPYRTIKQTFVNVYIALVLFVHLLYLRLKWHLLWIKWLKFDLFLRQQFVFRDFSVRHCSDSAEVSRQ